MLTRRPRLHVTDLLAGNQPLRVLRGGGPALPGSTLVERVHAAATTQEGWRRALTADFRGPEGLAWALPVPPSHHADMACLFMDESGWPALPGHAPLALGRLAVETGLVPHQDPLSRFTLETLAGTLTLEVVCRSGEIEGVALEMAIPIRETALGVTLRKGPQQIGLADLGGPVALLTHPAPLAVDPAELARTARELGGLVGRLQACIFAGPDSQAVIGADGTLDRSPSATGLAVRLALSCARGELRPGDILRVQGPGGAWFEGHAMGDGLCRVTGETDVLGDGVIFPPAEELPRTR